MMGDDDNVIVLPGVQHPQPETAFDESSGLVPPAPHMMPAVIEALLVANGEPISEADLNRFMADPGLPAVREALDTLAQRLRASDSGLRLVTVAKEWQIRTDPMLSSWIAAMKGGKPVRLSRAALETLAMVAYKQPVTRAQIEEIRGVDSGGVVRTLCDRGLMRVQGRLTEQPGQPLIFSTTPRFLSMFGLRDLSELPTLSDLRDLRADDPQDGPVPIDEDEPGWPAAQQSLLPPSLLPIPRAEPPARDTPIPQAVPLSQQPLPLPRPLDEE